MSALCTPTCVRVKWGKCTNYVSIKKFLHHGNGSRMQKNVKMVEKYEGKTDQVAYFTENLEKKLWNM